MKNQINKPNFINIKKRSHTMGENVANHVSEKIFYPENIKTLKTQQ